MTLSHGLGVELVEIVEASAEITARVKTLEADTLALAARVESFIEKARKEDPVFAREAEPRLESMRAAIAALTRGIH